MDAQTALPIAQQADALTAYASPLCLMEDQLSGHSECPAVLCGQRLGHSQLLRILQQVCGAVADGHMGQNTVYSGHSTGKTPATLLAAYCAMEANHYRGIVRRQPHATEVFGRDG